MNRANVVIVLADGFEEMEALTPMDVLRRLGCNVVLAGLNGLMVHGAHGLTVSADCTLADCNCATANAIVLPGGLPGATNLQASTVLRNLLQEAERNGKITAAICAAPIVLQDAGLLKGKKHTGYPGSEKLAKTSGLCYSGASVERDGNVITGKGPGAAFLFSREIALSLGCPENEFRQLAASMMVAE